MGRNNFIENIPCH